MTSSSQGIPSVAQIARALEGPFVGDDLKRPEWASNRAVVEAEPVFALACFGGPFELTDDFRPQLCVRMKAVRSRLKALAPRLEDVSDAELKKWLFDHGKSREDQGREGERLKEAACLLFQLESDHPSKGREKLRREINLLWNKDSEQSRWFKLNRQEFICEKFATWLHEDEQRHRANALDKAADKPRRQPVRLKEKSAAEKQRHGQRADDRPPKQPTSDRQREEKASPPSHTKSLLLLSASKRDVAVVGGLAIFLILLFAVSAFLDKDSPRIFGESLRSSTSPELALECASGKTDDFRISPTHFPANPELVDPEALSVNVGQVTFWFELLTHRDRPVGNDSWDFLFKPRHATDDLTFIFRRDISSGGGFGYVIDGPPGAGLEPRNDVCRLIDFHKTEMGEFLKARSDDEGLEWAASVHAQ